MKKKVFGRKLSRERDTRRALFRSLTRSLVINGRIKTTKAKAKAVRGDIEKLVTLAKRGDVASRRRMYARLANDRTTCDFIVNKVAPAFSDKTSGFTKIINLPKRVGDAAEMVRLEWSKEIEKQEQLDKAKKRKAKEAKVKTTKKSKVEQDKKGKTQRSLKNVLRRGK